MTFSTRYIPIDFDWLILIEQHFSSIETITSTFLSPQSLGTFPF